MSIASVPGFRVLFPSGSYAGSEPATPASQNPYQQQLTTLESWQNQVLQESLSGNTADATSALYASAGLSADQFANLAAELQNLGSTIDTSA